MVVMENIRNFSIIAHIDHGKSTLADRMLEITGTIEARKMQDQVLDSMELERERGITIKMQPVRMVHHPDGPERSEGQEYILNLIDTPGHIDFSYEVSRALKAVEGSILLVDSTQGVQAQTLTTLGMARESGLIIIPVLSKIDSPLARVSEVRAEVVKLLDCNPDDILEVSGKTGEGVENLLLEVIKRIPPPKVLVPQAPGNVGTGTFRALVFDFKYSTHRGVIVFVRVMSGSISKNTSLVFKVAKEKFTAIEVGIFSPGEVPTETLSLGEIGYIVTGIKEPGIASVGDTVAEERDTLPPLTGYEKPHPVVWASIYPESQDDFITLKQSLGKLKLSDSSYTYEEESSGSLGRGFRCGFLGMLHLEIITERLHREFNLDLVVTMPTITYEVLYKTGPKQGKWETIYSPSHFPDEGLLSEIREPWVECVIITPSKYLGNIMTLLYEHEVELGQSENFGDERTRMFLKMPLRELMRNFFDKLKSVSSGFASISYEILGKRPADVVRMDILVADEVLPAFSRVISRRIVESEAESMVEKLHAVLPRQMFVMKIQAKALGRIISSRTVSAFSKDVTQHMYGGDITRKMKLREKQKKGKKKMKARGKVNIPQDVFLKMMRS
ncbi:MAG: Elongation factor 4 [Parcubacteria group bacterium GW2011_GWF2_39_8b]|uniref:Elongation factor 4 n=1 Tax=Candidatus Zambryskibacteria bacterium RIFCSPHIGHO2_12_FULL_38_37 TaxID=1802751 RepID=A0A1G2TLU2_9BACT|nr:MAG: Elongation factor 4 [Parcubacteria group bacterium GW2011_GWF2_39_8b]OHA95474.1 MAG: elongation factor 4 [Candidatus Zambryskibacteria bacterium RIFCSPHIGHO2_02_FULL_39_82]OHA98152.1 MAG: elongation factor 4 [Candidatus Zambryskibacteria bacterium RIFCSPHIGHO2_12_FULL_38_37]OHB07655.1 MAG: elongation factor 4 [Candidatus Zambryskibacteria bacterium RIFCSPLOWO2_02_39_10]OHB10139.1 MAG: elongation factor 4 [Candidatus Zambryskibacteria bacterium RIFCSPLOWO2_02_FULL_39_69]OHB13557.1 MAG: 